MSSGELRRLLVHWDYPYSKGESLGRLVKIYNEWAGLSGLHDGCASSQSIRMTYTLCQRATSVSS